MIAYVYFSACISLLQTAGKVLKKEGGGRKKEIHICSPAVVVENTKEFIGVCELLY
jgi:hypothetical protein